MSRTTTTGGRAVYLDARLLFPSDVVWSDGRVGTARITYSF
jgi:hypothetical protein